jgi:hypothetical protein
MEKSTVCIDDLARGEEEERGKERESYHTWRFYHMVMPQASNTSTLSTGLFKGLFGCLFANIVCPT